MSNQVEVLQESTARAQAAIDELRESGQFRCQGLTLGQWLDARDNYLSQLVDLGVDPMAVIK